MAKKLEEIKRSKSEEIQSRRIQILKYEEKRRIERREKKRKMEEEINNRIEQIRLMTKKEEEFELNEKRIEDDKSRHDYRIKVLKDLVNQFIRIYRLNDINKIFEIINIKGNIKQSNHIYRILDILNKIGKIFKKEIDYDKKYSKDNIINLSDAIKSEDILYQFLGIIGEELNTKYNINLIIDKRVYDINLINSIFKILLSPYSTLTKYIINVRDESLKLIFLQKPKEFFDYIENLKIKISHKYKIDIEKLYIISYKNDLSEFTLVILNGKKFNFKKLKKSFNLKIEIKPLLENFKLYPDFFENKFNKDKNSWKKKDQIRGGEKYIPPIGWKGFGLKVLNIFDKGDNSWLGNEGKEGEWSIAYHGIGKENIIKKLFNIILNNLKSGPCQLYKSAINIRDKNGSSSGIGVYLSDKIKVAKNYAKKVKLGNSSKNYQFVIMCRVNPNQIRVPSGFQSYIIVDDSYECVRPYRILVKES